MTIRAHQGALRVRLLTHSTVFPITRAYWRVKHFLRTVETVLIEGWSCYVAGVWALCLFFNPRGLFGVAPFVFGTMSTWADEWVWGAAALAVAVMPIWHAVQPAVCWHVLLPTRRATHTGHRWALERREICFRPRTVAPVVGALFYGGLAGGLAAQDPWLPGAAIWGGFSLVSAFLFWRRLID